jgi:hypothetical protein
MIPDFVSDATLFPRSSRTEPHNEENPFSFRKEWAQNANVYIVIPSAESHDPKKLACFSIAADTHGQGGNIGARWNGRMVESKARGIRAIELQQGGTLEEGRGV